MMEQTTTGANAERPPYGLRRSIAAVKDAVPIEDYAATLTELCGTNGTLRGRCPIHGGDSLEAFCVYPEEGRWWCYRCSEGGDVIDLCRAVEGGEIWEVMLSLAMRFGVVLSKRPEAWHQHQGEKAERRRMIRNALTSAYQRRYFRVFGSYLYDIADPQERKDEAQQFFEDLRTVAVASAENRMSR